GGDNPYDAGVDAGEEDTKREAWVNLARAVIRGVINVLVARHNLRPAVFHPIIVVEDKLADIVLVERGFQKDRAVFYTRLDLKDLVGGFASLDSFGRWLADLYRQMEPLAASKKKRDMGTVLTLILKDEARNIIEVPLEDCGMGPGLGVVDVSVVDGMGNEIVPSHPYHFDVRAPETLNLARYVEEPEELPDLPAFLQVEPYQK
ncbi:MAG: hypothetical protein ACPLRM_00150, partial [Anaerolineae bacterium]